jgi:hypothetical protein
MSNRPTARQQRRHDRVRAMGCSACLALGYGEGPAEIHHVQDGQLGVRDHDKVLPLCYLHHRHGKYAIHLMSDEAWEHYTGKTQAAMLAEIDAAVPHK